MNLFRFGLLPMLILSLAPAVVFADELHVAAWNLEHLDDTDGEGCVGREGADYAALTERVEAQEADVIAFQEVENAAAAHRIFTESDWHVEMSGRPTMKRTRACWDRPEATLGHLGTGFAIRKGITYRRNEDLKALGGDDAFQRWGTDITIMAGGGELRLLSIHLKSGCWGERQDRDDRRKATCATLRDQIMHVRGWVDARRSEDAAFVILGDFNRRLTLPGDWGWELLSSPAAPLRLLTAGVAYDCDPRFSEHIDHLVAGGAAAGVMLVEGSFRQWPYQPPHPDHCAVSSAFRMGR